jgi:hypothetical protein
MTAGMLAAIEELFWPNGFARDMWMIVDGARDRRVYSSLIHTYSEHTCLYAGNLSPALERAAPYLVQLEFDDRYTRELIQQAWGNSWGIFLRSNDNIDSIRRHLRQFLRVKDRQGRTLIFRYYDPRVMRIFLPTCNHEELREIFGAFKGFYVEDKDPEVVLDYRRENGLLVTNKVYLRLTAPR